MIRNPTIIIGICSVIVFLILAANVILPSDKDDPSIFNKTKIGILLTLVFMVLPLIFVKLYAVNCMLEGNCDTLVWILVAISTICTLVYVIAFVLKVIKFKRNQTIAQESK